MSRWSDRVVKGVQEEADDALIPAEKARYAVLFPDNTDLEKGAVYFFRHRESIIKLFGKDWDKKNELSPYRVVFARELLPKMSQMDVAKSYCRDEEVDWVRNEMLEVRKCPSKS